MNVEYVPNPTVRQRVQMKRTARFDRRTQNMVRDNLDAQTEEVLSAAREASKRARALLNSFREV